MEIKQFIQTYNQSYSRNDTVFNSNQLQYLRIYKINEISLRKNKELFNIYFNTVKGYSVLAFRRFEENKCIFEFTNASPSDTEFSYQVEVEKGNSFDIIRKAIEYGMLELTFEDFKI